MPRLPSADLIHVTSVRYAGDYVLRLQFSDGFEGLADLAAYTDRPAFRTLRDVRVFARARLQEHYTVAWPGNIDVAPEFLYEITAPLVGGGVKIRNLAHDSHDAESERAAQCDRMPEISRFFGIVIRMFYNEHTPPHFHARHGRHVMTVDIRNGAITTHRFPKRALRLVLEWHELHRRELLGNWERMRRDEAPLPIAPLK